MTHLHIHIRECVGHLVKELFCVETIATFAQDIEQWRLGGHVVLVMYCITCKNLKCD